MIKKYILDSMERNILLIITIALGIYSQAQEYKVESFEIVPKDLSARTEGRVDGNGRKCAVIKVYVKDTITDTDGPVVGDIRDRGMEKWIYVSHDAKQVGLLFKEHMPLQVIFADYDYPTVTGQMTYILKLTESTPNSGVNYGYNSGEIELSNQTSSQNSGITHSEANHNPINNQGNISLKDIKQILEAELGKLARIEEVSSKNGSESLKIIIGCGEIFPTGKSHITNKAKGDLYCIIESLKEHSNLKVNICVYTDNTGSFKVNKNISDERSNSLASYFIEQGVSPNSISSEGKPMCDYIAENNTSDGRAANRRIEIILTESK